MVNMESLSEYTSEKLKCSFQTKIRKAMLIRNAGSVLVKLMSSVNEFGFDRLKINRVMAIPKTASVRFSSREAVVPR